MISGFFAIDEHPSRKGKRARTSTYKRLSHKPEGVGNSFAYQQAPLS